MAVAVGGYYRWGVRAAGNEFEWGQDSGHYYDYLGRAFAGGHLYLPLEPSPQLLAQPNPWDPRVDDSLKLFDAVLYNRRYYLYHGPGPAVMLFTPWRLITGHDLPENYALFVLCLGGYLFSAGALMGMFRLAQIRVRPGMLAMMLLALGTCQGVPFLLNRVWVYEVAIGGGYFCIAAALFFLVRGFESSRPQWLAAAGFMFGMAVACRPHLAIVGAIALAAILFTSWRRVIYFVTPLLIVGMTLATYNYERFGSPLEFGNRYLLSGPNQSKLNLAPANVRPGMYYLLLSAPEFSPVFPWVLITPHVRDFPRPATNTVEPTTGAIYLAPFLPFVLLVLFAPRVRLLLGVCVVSGLLVLWFIAATGWSTQRYEVDLLPLLILVCLGGFAVVTGRVGKYWRWALSGVLCVAIICGATANLALGLAGPYDEMKLNKPARFVRIAGWFSPIGKFRPALNPRIDVSFKASPGPLFFAGQLPWRYELSMERAGAKANLVSHYNQSTVTQEMADGIPGIPGVWRVTYTPESGEMHVNGDGREVLVHKIGTLVSAPVQIRVP
jgi:hypothetical protein